jgi:hypothetical protein
MEITNIGVIIRNSASLSFLTNIDTQMDNIKNLEQLLKFQCNYLYSYHGSPSYPTL